MRSARLLFLKIGAASVNGSVDWDRSAPFCRGQRRVASGTIVIAGPIGSGWHAVVGSLDRITEAAVPMLTEALSASCRERGIRCTGVPPSFAEIPTAPGEIEALAALTVS